MTGKLKAADLHIDDFDILLCDLGGVVIHLGEFPAMTTSHLADPWDAWLHSPTVRQHESGQLEISEFVTRAITEFQLDIKEDAFLDQFATWPGRPYDLSVNQLVRLRSHCQLVSLSNTNRFHWQIFANWPGFLELFDHHLPSFRTGLMKPDSAVFHHVVAELDAKPQRTLFIDDNELNVNAALAAGLQALVIRGEDEFAALTDLLLDATSGL